MSRHDVRLVKRYGPTGGIAVFEFDGDTALWTTVKLRKHARCAVSSRALAPGEEAFRPVGNQMYRMERIAPEAVDDLEREQGGTT